MMLALCRRSLVVATGIGMVWILPLAEAAGQVALTREQVMAPVERRAHDSQS